MLVMRSFTRSRIFWLIGCFFGWQFLFSASAVGAATCTISADTVVNQAYVTSNSCTAINIQGNVSTTWIGTVDLGGGTVTVKSTYTMTMGSSSQMILGASDDFVIEANATTTHRSEDPYGIQITARNVTITGKLNADGKGCRGGPFSGLGYGPNLTTGVCAQGITGYGAQMGGGSHGSVGGPAYGGTVSMAYGTSTAPVLLGSGGGGSGFSGNDGGGAGGGVIQLTVSGALTVNGSITANGVTGISYAGGGSGGSIYIRAGTIAGSGTIVANGGSRGVNTSSGSNGYGAGGRIAVYYDSATFDFSTLSYARTGTNSDSDFNGTAYFLDRATDDGSGTVQITSGFDFPSGYDATRLAYYAVSGTRLGCAAQTSLQISATTMSLSGSYWNCSSAITTLSVTGTSVFYATNTNWTFSNATNVSFDGTSAFSLSTSTIRYSKVGSLMRFGFPSSISLTNVGIYGPASMGTASADGGRLFLTDGINLSMASSAFVVSTVSSTLASLSLDSTSKIDVSERGCAGTTASSLKPNAAGVCATGQSGTAAAAAGGGYGGAGGTGYSGGAGGTTYGSSTNPTLPGGSGGQAVFTTNFGGTGGGLIRLTISGNLVLSGKIWANGGAYIGGQAGGGSGGGIYLRVSGVISGSGTVQANGGIGLPSGGSGGGGGGGRVAVLYSSLSGFSTSSNITVSGASGATGSGSAGTIYTLQTNQSPDVPSSLAPTALVNGGTTGTTTPTFTFSLSDPDVADTVKFQIQIDDSSNFGSPVVDYTSALGSQGAFSFQVGQAVGAGAYTVGSNGQTLSNGSYYWRVKTIDSNASESSYTTANSGSVAFIVDSTARTIGFELSSGSGLESVTATSIKIVLNTTHFENVTVNYSATGGAADGSGTDYTLASGTATITAGDTSTTIALSLVNDSIDEPNETVVITLSSPVYASIGSTSTYTYTITDNDSAGITFSKSTVSVTEGGATDSYTVVLDSQPTSTLRLSFSTSTFGVTLSTSTIEFTSSTWNTPISVTVTATDDEVDEPSSHTSFIVSTATIPTGYAYGYDALTLSDITATIADNDTAGVSFSKTALAVAEGGATDTYTVSLTSQPTSTVRVTFTTSTLGVALSAATVDFTSLNWNTPVTITATAVDDTVDESASHEGLITSVASVLTGYAYGYDAFTLSDITATIADNEGAGVTLSKTSVFLTEEGVQDTYTIVLTSAPTSTVTISLSVNNSDLTVSPASVSFTPSNWNEPQTITVSATDDPNIEGDQTRTISHVLAVASYAFGYSDEILISPVSAFITDNDAAGGGASAAVVPFVPLPPLPELVVTTPIPSPVGTEQPKTDLVSSGTLRLLEQDQREFRTNLTLEQKESFGRFIEVGTSLTVSMGERERRALVRDALDTLGEKTTLADLERMTRGQIPESRNIVREREQLARVRTTFRTLYGRDPNFKNTAENLAWNAMMYRLRFPRDLIQERRGVGAFRAVFGRAPQDPFQWAVVRVLGYVKN